MAPIASSYTYDESDETNELAKKRKLRKSFCDCVNVENGGQEPLAVILKSAFTVFSTVRCVDQEVCDN